ncbi:MAG: trypsin-like peptidase domain-containing protein [Proteobacteria bacterium]|nr:trypsin-like peptidase domain-containing protein [Pseudomonadota bacterium]
MPLAIALEHMTGPFRGSVTWLGASVLDVTLDAGRFIHITEARAGEPKKDRVARFHRVDDTYEVEIAEGQNVWVNGERVTVRRLKHGDTIEFGETGPLCRCRVYTSHSPVRNSAADILSDIGAYLRVSRQPLAKRTFRAFGAFFGRLSYETSMLFRFTVLGAIIGFGLLAYQQHQLNSRLQQGIDRAATQLDSVATAVINAQKEALRPSDLAALRDNLEQRVISNAIRLEELEQRSTASGRVIAAANASVAFLQGIYGFRERSGKRMLRQVVSSNGVPLFSPRGQPLLSLDGNGPLVELQFTGTAFVIGEDGVLITNRHVALPWERNAGTAVLAVEGVEAVMIKFIAYLPGEAGAVPVSLFLASDTADLAILRYEGGSEKITGLNIAQALPVSGDEVIVMGYPTGLRSMLAQSGAEFIAELQKEKNTGFWSVAAKLAENGYIAPLASRGIVSQVTTTTIVYDAETTYGGSGGPVLDINGDVVAVNAAILPEYGGSNFGVPIAEVQALLKKAATK